MSASAPAIISPDVGAAILPACWQLLVIRHGEREDEADDNWSQQSATPWDPPLSEQGREQVAEAAKRLADHRVSRVVTSPFARCLETTGALLDSLGLPWSCCSVDARFGEVMDGSILARGAEVRPPEDALPAEWLWEGTSMEDAVREALPPGAGAHVRIACAEMPAYPETVSHANRRYHAALAALAAELLQEGDPQQATHIQLNERHDSKFCSLFYS